MRNIPPFELKVPGLKGRLFKLVSSDSAGSCQGCVFDVSWSECAVLEYGHSLPRSPEKEPFKSPACLRINNTIYAEVANGDKS